MRRTQTLLIVAILLVAAVFRLWRIHEIPPSISWDEAAISYNAWSLLQTGKDEYGSPMPLLFRSFEDYKLPGMIYTTALSIGVFGLNEVGTRVPSALFGVGIVYVLYRLGVLVFSQFFKTRRSKSHRAGCVIAAVAAVNPWLISFSRQAFESNGSTFFMSLGMYFLLSWIVAKKKNHLVFSAAFFSISVYFYYAARVAAPLVILCFAALYWRMLLQDKRESLFAVGIGIVLLIPILPKLFSDAGYSRIGQVALSSDPRYKERVERYIGYHRNFTISPGAARILFGPKKALLDEFGANYLRNISPVFLFYNGAGLHGLLYYWEAPFLLLGIYLGVLHKGREKWMLLAWLVVYPIAASATKDQPNALRTLIGAPVLVLFTGVGLARALFYIRARSYKYTALLLTCVISGGSILYFLNVYFYKQPVVRAHDFGDGHKQMISYVDSRRNEYDTIWVTGDYWRPYIHFLYHTGYDPARYQEEWSRARIENIYFGGEWDSEGVQLGLVNLNEYTAGRTLFILTDREYRLHTDKGEVFAKAVPIDGRYSPHEFWALEL